MKPSTILEMAEWKAVKRWNLFLALLISITTNLCDGSAKSRTDYAVHNVSSVSRNKAAQICSTFGERLLVVDSKYKKDQLEYTNASLNFLSPAPASLPIYWIDLVLPSPSKDCNSYVWGDCTPLDTSYRPWEDTPSSCDLNRCAYIDTSRYEWNAVPCDTRRAFVCEKTNAGDCDFEPRQVTPSTLSAIGFGNMSVTNMVKHDCQHLCQVTELDDDVECWMYAHDVTTHICRLYLLTYSREIFNLWRNDGRNSDGTNTRAYFVKICSRYTNVQTVEASGSNDVDSENPSVVCQTLQQTPDSCFFIAVPVSLLESQSVTGSMTFDDTEVTLCKTRCRNSQLDTQACQAVLVIGGSTQTCTLFFGSGRFRITDQLSTTLHIQAFFRSCNATSAATTTTTAPTTTITPATTTATPATTTTTPATTTTTPATTTTTSRQTTTTSPTTTSPTTATTSLKTTKTATSTTNAPVTPRPKDEFGLSVPKKALSSFKKKYISVYESRPSAVSMGMVGIAMIAGTVVLIIASDARILWRHIVTIGLKNIKEGLSSQKRISAQPDVELEEAGGGSPNTPTLVMEELGDQPPNTSTV